MKLLDDVAGLSVLDLACGEGYDARLIRRAGAARVVGVDLSGEMIALARREEACRALGIEYIHSAAQDLGTIGAFDLVSAAYLLHYSSSQETLLTMCRTAASNLKPGGRFVTILSNYGEHPGVDYREYLMDCDLTGPPSDGQPYHVTFLMGPETFAIQNYHYSRAIYEDRLHRAGFRSVRWINPMVSPEGVAEYGEEFWRVFRETPPIVFIECQK
jgi:SAM-dependent methyltransferase